MVTQEVDAAFTTWTNSYRVQFPKATPGSLYIGTNSLSQLMPKLESDPTVPAWAKAPNAPKEADPKFREWVVKPTLSITNNGVRFKNATTNTILIGDKALGQYFLPKSYQESDPRFGFWYERPTLILTNEAVRLSANPTNFYIGGRAFPSYFEGYLKSYSETDPDFHRWLDVDTLTFNNRKVVMPSTFYIGTNTFLSYFDGFLREYHETDPKFNTWLGQDTLTFANRKVVVPETFYIGTNKFLSYFDGFLREYHETDPKFYDWLAYDTITFTNRKVAVSNGFHVANANSFYIEGRKFPSYFDGLLTEENDPLFSKWTETNTYVKVESDPQFSKFMNSRLNIAVGQGSTAGDDSMYWYDPKYGGSITIGVPGSRASGWNTNFLGNAYAIDHSVAIGYSAKARHNVSVAIGNMAYVGELHGTRGLTMTNYLAVKKIITTNVNGVATGTYTEIRNHGTPIEYDPDKWEAYPRGVTDENGMPEYKYVSTSTNYISEGVNVVTVKYEQKMTQLPDRSYISTDETNEYVRIVDSGQGKVNLADAIYGVAVGSRAYVFGYHGAAYGHYAHVSRPFGLAIGSESHVYSEGSQAFGFDSDIPEGSPYSMALGLNASVSSGMTNAIVIGMPRMGERNSSGLMTDRPKAMKSHSINFVYQGNGIEDFFIDNKSLQNRLGSEVKVVGNTKRGVVTSESVMYTLGLTNDTDIVFASADGAIRLYTKSYIDGTDENVHLDEIIINGKTLEQIFSEAHGEDTGFRAIVRNAAVKAQNEITTNANSIAEVKGILTTFFNEIQ